MTDQERVARLEGIVETWNRVLDENRRASERRSEQHEKDLLAFEKRSEALEAKMDRITDQVARLAEQVAQMRGWIIGAVAIMGVFTAVNAALG